MPLLPRSGADIVRQTKSSAQSKVAQALSRNGPKPNNTFGSIQVRSAIPIGFSFIIPIIPIIAKIFSWIVSTFAGDGFVGSTNGPGTSAQFNYPQGVAVDSLGNVYVADNENNRIRKITPAGIVSYFAGDGTQGFMDGSGASAQFNNPQGVAVDSADYVYVSDRGNNRIRKITPAGAVSTFAGSTQGFQDGSGASAQFNNPYGVAVDSAGYVYVADTYNHRIRKITPTGAVSTLAGSTRGFLDGIGTVAQFRYPYGVAVDSAGYVYVADSSNQRIRKIRPDGFVSTLAGDGTWGFLDGAGTSAQFNSPYGIVVDSAGNVYVADTSNNRIRKITPAGVVSTLAGDGTLGFQDGDGIVAQFSEPWGVAVDSSDNVYVADNENNRIRKITYTQIND